MESLKNLTIRNMANVQYILADVQPHQNEEQYHNNDSTNRAYNDNKQFINLKQQQEQNKLLPSQTP